MKTEVGNHLISNHRLVQSNVESPKTNRNYNLHKSKTLSQSAQSKLKNLAYTLSRPFRSLIKGHIDNSIGVRNATAAMKNIHSSITPVRSAEADSAKSTKISGDTHSPYSQPAYTFVGGKEGYRSPTLAERLWG